MNRMVVLGLPFFLSGCVIPTDAPEDVVTTSLFFIREHLYINSTDAGRIYADLGEHCFRSLGSAVDPSHRIGSNSPP